MQQSTTTPFPAAVHRRSKLVLLFKTLVTLGFLLYAGLFAYHAYCVATFPYDVDNSEGFLLYAGHRLATGGGFYGDINRPPYLVDNYPPFYPFLLAIGDRLVGTRFVWGRSLSVGATLGIAILIYAWIAGMSGRVWPGLVASLCFLSFYHVYDWAALARVDMVAIFFSVLGLVLVERGKGLMFPVACFVLSLCTRQTMFAAPLAAFLYMYYREERRGAAMLLGSVLVVTGLLYGLFQLLSGGGFIRHVFLYNLNEYRPWDLFVYFNHWWSRYTVVGGIALFFFLHRLRLRRRDLVVYYLFLSWLSALLCGKIGSAPNYLLEMVVASCLALGSILAEVEVTAEDDRPVLSLLLPILLVAQLLATMHWPHTRLDFSYTPTRADRYESWKVEQILSRATGPVLAERPGLALIAGHEPVYQPFIFRQLARQGLWDPAPFLEKIKRQEFFLIVLTWDLFRQPVDTERFSESFVAAVKESYEIERRLGRLVIYHPRGRLSDPQGEGNIHNQAG